MSLPVRILGGCLVLVLCAIGLVFLLIDYGLERLQSETEGVKP